jgi:hypothetical protein
MLFLSEGSGNARRRFLLSRMAEFRGTEQGSGSCEQLPGIVLGGALLAPNRSPAIYPAHSI